jgi:Bacterial PH domain
MTNYPSKRDLGVALVVLPLCLGMVGLGLFLLALVLIQGATLYLFMPGLLLAALGMLNLWAFLSTSYQITQADLLVRFGPLRWHIPLNAIAEIVPSGTLAPDRGWGLAWSLDRLVIRYRKGNGKLAFMGIVISPEDKDGFLHQLDQARRDLSLRGSGCDNHAER